MEIIIIILTAIVCLLVGWVARGVYEDIIYTRMGQCEPDGQAAASLAFIQDLDQQNHHPENEVGLSASWMALTFDDEAWESLAAEYGHLFRE